MALGGNVNQNQSMWEPSYYSRLRIKNPSENLALGFTFWKGTLKISIGDINNIQDGRNSELAYIHLSPTKARILADGVNRVIKTPDADNVFGVDTGTGETRGFIAIGRKLGVPFLFIAKVTSDGRYESSQRFTFNSDYNYLLKVHDIDSLKFQKEYMNNIELQQFSDILSDYARCASGALGASFHDIGRYEVAKISGIIRKIAEKTGAIDSRNGFNKSSNSFFSGVGSDGDSSDQKSAYQNIDDLDRMLG